MTAQPNPLSIDEALSTLDTYKESFLNRVEAEVKSLINNSRKRDCTAVVTITPGGTRVKRTANDRGWVRCLIAISKANGSTPTFEGCQVDSWLSQPIVEKVESLHMEFIESHGDIVSRYIISSLGDNAAVRHQIANRLARQVAQSSWDVSEPFTEELVKALAHIIHLQLSSSLTSDLSLQLNTALTHAAGATAVTSFATLFQSAIAKVLAKFAITAAIKTTLPKLIGKTVIGAFIAILGSHLAAHGIGLASGPWIYLLLFPAAAIFTMYELEALPGKLADKMGPEVRMVMSGEFQDQNRSVLSEICDQALEDGGRIICDALVEESGFSEQALNAAREMLEAEDPTTVSSGGCVCT